MTCSACGNESFHDDLVSETFRVGGSLIVVEKIPSLVCDRCGEPTFSAEVGERVRRLVQEPHKPARVVQAEIVEYRAA